MCVDRFKTSKQHINQHASLLLRLVTLGILLSITSLCRGCW